MFWISLAILATAVYGASSFVDKVLIEKRIKNPMALTILGGFFALFVGLIILAIQGFPAIPALPLIVILFAGLLSELALLPYYKAISMDDASKVTPIFQTIPIFVLILSYFIIKETLQPIQIGGFFIVLLGGLVLSIEGSGANPFKIKKSFWYMILASFCYALPMVLFKAVILQDFGFWTTLGYEFVGYGIAATILLGVYLKNAKKEFKNMPKSTWAIISLNEGFYIFARFCSFYAAVLAPISLVAVIGGTQPLFTLLYGIVLSVWFPKIISEDIRKATIALKLAVAAFMLVGIWMIAG
jgi:drug/metabolite transporter (DMT)-like permease